MVAEKTRKKKTTNNDDMDSIYQLNIDTDPLQSKINDLYTSKIEKKVDDNKKDNKKQNNRYNYNIIIYIVVGFIMLFIICYRNSLINESYTEKENLKSQLSEIQKENEQLRVNIESSLNLSSIEKTASEQLGMKKLTNDQKVYVNLQKKDYVESGTDEIEIETEVSLIDKILNGLTKIIQ